MPCTNITAVNYNTNEPCLYLDKIGSNCYAFEDAPITDKSFTLSYSIELQNWVFFHDVFPSMWFNSRRHLFSLQDNRFYKASAGVPGIFNGSVIKPFYIDLVFQYPTQQILDSVQWISDVVTAAGIRPEFETFTHVTVWNRYQCSGKIAVAGLAKLNKSIWAFNDFKDHLLDPAAVFLSDIFSDTRPNTVVVPADRPWFEQSNLTDSWFIVRLEYDNTTGNTIVLHEAGDASKAFSR